MRSCTLARGCIVSLVKLMGTRNVRVKEQLLACKLNESSSVLQDWIQSQLEGAQVIAVKPGRYRYGVIEAEVTPNNESYYCHLTCCISVQPWQLKIIWLHLNQG